MPFAAPFFCWYATCTSLIIHLICPSKFCINFVFHFSWVLQPSQEKLKTMLVHNFVGQIRCIVGDVQVAYDFIIDVNCIDMGFFFFQIWSKSLCYHASCCLFFLLITVQLTSIVLMSTNFFQIWSSLAELAVGFTNGLIFWMNSEFFQLLCFYIPWQRAKWDGYIRRPLVITLPNSTLFRVPAFQPFLVEISSCWLNIALHLIFAFFAWIWKPETGQCKLNPEMIYLIDSSFNTASSRKQGRIQKIQKGAAGTLASYSENS